MTQTINLQSSKVGFIGGGNMARAIGIALIKKSNYLNMYIYNCIVML